MMMIIQISMMIIILIVKQEMCGGALRWVTHRRTRRAAGSEF
jgi:hypothetical protein